MAKAKRIDWKRARAAEDGLRQLAADHPKLLGAAGASNRAGWEEALANDARDVTLEKVSRDFAVTRRRVRQIETKAFHKLRPESRARFEAARGKDDSMATSKMVAFRLPTDMVKRLDAHAGRLAAMTGLEVTRADVVKLLLGRGLDAVERAAKGGGRARRR